MKTVSLVACVSLCLLAGNVRAVEFPSGDVPSNVGVSFHFQPGFVSDGWDPNYEAKLDLIQQAGIGVVRTGIDWVNVEPTVGAREWDVYDRFVRACADRGIRVMATLGYGNWAYGNIYDPNYFDNPTFRDAYTAYASDVVSRYSNFTDSHGAPIPKMTYELWNEPNGGGGFWARDTTIHLDPGTGQYVVGDMDLEKQYVRRAANQFMAMAMQALPVMRQNDPNATIVAPGLSWANEYYNPELGTEYINTCLNYASQYGSHGLLDSVTINGRSVPLIDGLSIHPYRYGNPESVTDSNEPVNYVDFQKMIDDAVPNSPVKIISGEWGYPQTYWSNITPQLQADYAVRGMLTNSSQNVPISIWYDFQDNRVDGPNGENNFGLLTLDGTKKPAYFAMQAMNSNLKNCTFWDKWNDGNSEHWVLRFHNNVDGEERMAVWTTGAAGVVTLLNGLGTTYLNGTPLYLGPVQHLDSGGTWSTATWSNSTNGVWVDKRQASFSANTTADVNTPVTVSGLQFAYGSYWYESSNSTLTNTTGNGQLRIGLGGAAIHVAQSFFPSTATINAPLVNENEDIPCNPAVCQVRKTGGGTLVLNARNTFTGNLLIAEGSVTANVADALYGPVVTLLSSAMNGGLQFGSGSEFHLGGLAGDKNLNYGTRILDIGESGVSNDADGLGYHGVLSGSGAIRKYGPGAFLLSHANSFSGTVDVYGGTLAVSDSSALSGGSSAIAVHGGSIDIRGCTLSRALTMDTAPITLANSALNTTSTLASNLDMRADVTFATTGTLNMSGRLGSATTDMRTATKIGAGALILSGSNDNAFLDLAVNSGTAQLSKASTEGVHAATDVTVAKGATVQYQGTGDYQVYEGGAIALNGGTIDFNGHNQIGTSMAITAAGSTIANTSANYSVYTPSSMAVSPIGYFSVNVAANSILNIQSSIICDTAGRTVWPQLRKTGAGALMLEGLDDNANLTLAVQEGVVAFNKASSPTVHTAIAADVGAGAKLQYATNGGDYQLAGDPGYWVHLTGGTLDFFGANQRDTDLTVMTAGSTVANGLANTTSVYTPRSFNYQQNFTVNTVGNLEINGAIRGDSVDWPSLTKTGAGTLTLSGTADNTRTTLIASEGTVKLNKMNTTWGLNAATAVAVNAGATVQYTGTGDYQVAPGNWIHLQGGTLDLNGRNQAGVALTSEAGYSGTTLANTAVGTASALTPSSMTLGANLTVNAVGNLEIYGGIVGNNVSWPALTKIGAGTLTLSGTNDNTYTTLIASEGTVKLNKMNTTWGLSAATAVAVNAGATVQYTGTGDYQVAPGNWIHLAGGTLDLNGRNQAGVDLTSEAGYIGSTLANTAAGTTSVLTPMSMTLNAGLTVNAIGDLTINGAVGGGGMLTKNGGGILTLTKANTFVGETAIGKGTVLADFSASGAPGTNILPSGYNLKLAGGTFRAKFNSSSNAQTVANTIVMTGASGVTADTAAGNVNLNAITRSAGGTVNFSTANGANIRTSTANGTFTGGRQSILGGYATYGGNTWAKTDTGTGTWSIAGLASGSYQTNFAATNDVDSPTSPGAIGSDLTINSLRFNKSTANSAVSISPNYTLTVASGGILVTPTVNNRTVTIGGSGNLSTNTSDLIVHQNNINNTMTISANITGSSKGLTKSGAGRLILSGTKSYTGTTTVNAGTLVLSSGTIGSTSGVTLNGGGTLLQNSSTNLSRSILFNGGTLGGTATYAYPTSDGTLTVGNGSHLAPGDPTVNTGNHGLGVGTFTISGGGAWTLGMNSSTVLDCDFNTVGGANYSDLLQLSGGTSRNVILDGTLNVIGSSIGLGTYTIISGASSITDLGLIMPADGYFGHHWSYAINGGSVIVTTAPEPGTIAILATALLSLAAYTWKRGRHSGK